MKRLGLSIRLLPLLSAATLIGLALACDTDRAGPATTQEMSPAGALTPAPAVEHERVSVREGRFLRGSQPGEANFSAALPPGWASVDSPVVKVKGLTPAPAGIIAKIGERYLRIEWVITQASTNSLMARSDSYRSVQREIGGVSTTWVVPVEPDFSDFERISVAYPHLPGDDEADFGVRLIATGIQDSGHYAEIESIFVSLQYASPPPPFSPPEPKVTPSADWEQVTAHFRDQPEMEVFSVLAPPGWEFNYVGGIDSFVGEFTDGDLNIFFDFGSLAMSPPPADMHIRYPGTDPELEFWSETIDGKPFVMFRPVSQFDHEDAPTGVSLDRLPGLSDLEIPASGTYSSSIYNCGGTFLANSLGRSDQELVLAILRTLHADETSACHN